MSKSQQVFSHLQKRSITNQQSLKLYGLMRLSSVIHRFRRAGHNINTEMVYKGKDQFAKYTLIK